MLLISLNNNYLFNVLTSNLIDVDPSLRGSNSSLYNLYISNYIDELEVENDYYWMPSIENKDKCPSTQYSNNEPCNINILQNIYYSFDLKGNLRVILDMPSSLATNFPGGSFPAGIRIYLKDSDQKTYFFDSFNDNTPIPNKMEFTIDKCDLFYFQLLGMTNLEFGVDFYDENGYILNDLYNPGCNQTFNIQLTNKIDLCDAIQISYERIAGPPPTGTLCKYKIRVTFDGCDDYGFIVSKMAESLKLVNVDNPNVKTSINTLNGFAKSYLNNGGNGEITFEISNITGPTDFQLVLGDDVNTICDFNFHLDCENPDEDCDCCEKFKPYLLACIRRSDYAVIKYGIVFENRGYTKYCPNCSFLNATVVLSTNPESGAGTVISSNIVNQNGGVPDVIEDTFEGKPAGKYKFTITTMTSQGPCVYIYEIEWNGTNTWIELD